MAGAASTGAPQPRPAVRQNSPAARAVRLRKTAPQPALSNHNGGEDWTGSDRGGTTGVFQRPDAAADAPAVQRGSHRARQQPDDDDDYAVRGRHGGRRRWPIVTTLLVVLLLALGGGAFASWQWVQGKYYIGADGNDVAIYHGINSSIFGMSLSSLQQNTGLPVARLSVPDQGAVRATVSYDSLAAAEQGLKQVQSQVNHCETQWSDLVTWKSKWNAYLAKLARYNQAKAHARPGTHFGTPPTPPGPQPATPLAMDCAAAAAFGIPASELPAAGTGSTTPSSTATKPATTPSATTSSTARASSRPTASSSASKKA
jgi:protein phosphatase